MSANLTVELFGLPGSGKTTLARHLAQAVPAPVVRRFSFWELLWLNCQYFVAQPRLSLVTLRLVLANCRDWHMLKYKLAMVASRQAKRAKAILVHGCAIMDEGPLQNTLSLPEQVWDESKLKRLIGLTPKPDALIVVTAPPSVIRARLDRRLAGPRLRWGQEYLRSWQEVSTANYQLVCRALIECWPDILFFESGSDPHQIVQKIMSLANAQHH